MQHKLSFAIIADKHYFTSHTTVKSSILLYFIHSLCYSFGLLYAKEFIQRNSHNRYPKIPIFPSISNLTSSSIQFLPITCNLSTFQPHRINPPPLDPCSRQPSKKSRIFRTYQNAPRETNCPLLPPPFNQFPRATNSLPISSSVRIAKTVDQNQATDQIPPHGRIAVGMSCGCKDNRVPHDNDVIDRTIRGPRHGVEVTIKRYNRPFVVVAGRGSYTRYLSQNGS